MTKILPIAILLLTAGAAQAEELVCQGNIVSTQGEGIVARKHRFEVSGIAGADIGAVLEQCRKIALERQVRAARKNPGGSFRRISEVELECTRGPEKTKVRRNIQTE
ncbi:hypothetical protein Gbem_0261 [Citrifermentans bemidjiense Bem]|uniref:Uncharacterized protein n=1 Tax=Citrifermentans bemidjiense (strain ATCC BAA-1014 / DSM 16622 / JCM 12645 / Bem) TaxID=404380 RepID=B5E9Z4_CITBB|nr:hypothetical protein [Citrifermentans bemidjiense]ACH37292.1 hypothetical protein Gbem_0261 [Citrifermentans bemidjiense Bem]